MMREQLCFNILVDRFCKSIYKNYIFMCILREIDIEEVEKKNTISIKKTFVLTKCKSFFTMHGWIFPPLILKIYN